MNELSFESFDDVMHNKLLLVPVYQRDYAWGDANVETFYEDLSSLNARRAKGETCATHFFGSIVLIKYEASSDQGSINSFTNPKLNRWNKYYLIDGQQRLTTFSLLFMVLREFVQTRELDIDFRSLLQTEQKDDDSLFCSVLNFTDENTQKRYKSLVNNEKKDGDGRTRGVKNLESSYELLKRKVNEDFADSKNLQHDVEHFIETVRYYSKFVEIICPSESDAYQIFESLNSTGLSLTPADQVKNLLLMKYSQKDAALRSWENLLDTVGEKSVVAFMAN